MSSAKLDPSSSEAADLAGVQSGGQAGTMVWCSDVSFAYPRSSFRLHIDTLRVAPGESIALVGPSGSGKSTLLDLIGGVRRPHAGEVWVDGLPIGTMSEGRRRQFRGRRVGFVFQSFELFDHLTARENILFPAAAAGRLRREHANFEEELSRLVEATRLNDRLLRQRTGTLSRGEQQRVALCRALIHRPSLVLADEPTGNLDPSNKQAAMRLLRTMVADHGTTLAVATHDQSLLADFDQVIDLDRLGAIE